MEQLEDDIRIMKTAPLLLRMEPSLKRRITERAEEQKVSISEIIREACRNYLEKSKTGSR